MRPPYMPAKKVKDMNDEEFLDYLEQQRLYGRGSREHLANDRYESNLAPPDFNRSSMQEPHQGFASSGFFTRWKSGMFFDQGDQEFLKEAYHIIL